MLENIAWTDRQANCLAMTLTFVCSQIPTPFSFEIPIGTSKENLHSNPVLQFSNLYICRQLLLALYHFNVNNPAICTLQFRYYSHQQSYNQIQVHDDNGFHINF